MKRRIPPFTSNGSPPAGDDLLRQSLMATTDDHPPPPPATSNHPTAACHHPLAAISDHLSQPSDFREPDDFSTRVKSPPEADKRLDAEIVRRSVASIHGHNHRGTKVARAVIRLLMTSLILGYLIIWIIMPTDTYRKTWRHKLRAMFNNSTYFGKQGMNLLLYMIPVLSVAGMSCMYLHLQKKMNDYNKVDSKKPDKWALWKSPVIVKRPLGIVSGVELSILIMFITLLVWSLWTYLNNSFATITPESAAKNGEHVWQSKLDSAALKLGLVGNICLAFLFFPVARGSSVLPLFGLTSEVSIKYHIWLGNITMAFLTAHGFCYIIYWASTNQISKMLEWKKTGVSNVAGELALLSGLFMWVTTIPRIRRKIFELFFYTHHLYILFIIFFVLHVGISYSFIMLPGFYLFMVDRYLRYLQSLQHVRLVSARILPCETVELNFSKAPGLRYSPTSVLFLNVPSISKLQWHPYTITSNSNLDAGKLSVVIKTEGSWSSKLYQMLLSSPVDRLEVSIEGPYGPTSTHFLRHNTLVMVSGGSGVTPFISIIREMIFMSTIFKSKIPKLLLICAFKNSSELSILDLILPISASPYEISSLELQIEAYVTREKEQSNRKFPRTMWFKPNAMDVPASAILGPNSWLWLGAIISSSFVIFLLLIGTLSHYYIYPIDQNTNKIFPYSLRSAMSILLLCISIATTSSIAVIWNKRQNAKESGQAQVMEGPLPGSWLDVADTEVESLPQQPLIQATNEHYGERPDLKRILLECKGGSVGVLACGPKKMRDDVATICSSGMAENLHFESISFSW